MTRATTTAYAAAVELCRAADTYRVLRIAGRVTDQDIVRVENARRVWDGSTALPPRWRPRNRYGA